MHSADPVELRPSQFSLRAASKGDQQTVYSIRKRHLVAIKRLILSAWRPLSQHRKEWEDEANYFREHCLRKVEFDSNVRQWIYNASKVPEVLSIAVLSMSHVTEQKFQDVDQVQGHVLRCLSV